MRVLDSRSIFLAVIVLKLGCIASTSISAQTVTGSVPSPVRELMLDILKEAGVAKARMMSRRRSTQQEAVFLYQLLENAENKSAIKKRYGPSGQKVIDVFLTEKNKPRVAVLARMDRELQKQITLLGDNRAEFAYVGPSKVHKYVVVPVFELDRSGMTSRLEAVLQDYPDLARWTGPVRAGGAFHIEIPKTLKTISGLWRGRCRETLADGESVRYRHVMKLKRTATGYSGLRKSPSLQSVDGERWVSSALEELLIDRRTKIIAYSYKDERGERIKIVGRLNADYNRIKFEHNSSKTKCKIRKRL